MDALGFESAAPRVVFEATQLGPLVGASPAMRVAFAALARAARTDATVLIEGETGTGKEGAAEALHVASPRRDGPLVVVDCGALPANLLESELFGHEKGAFTGATARRIGAFEEARGGTIFLDEIGELPLDLQPKLLRVLERKDIRRLGSNARAPVDVRIVAATNRDLRTAVNAGRFRSDLYFRLAVVKVQLPPLRKRADDIPLLVERLLTRIGASPELVAALCTPAFLGRLKGFAWPGNVRELRNYLERCVVFQRELPLGDDVEAVDSSRARTVDRGVYADARRRALDAFEKRYLEQLLVAHGGRVDGMAAEAGLHRVSLYRLLRRHGLKAGE